MDLDPEHNIMGFKVTFRSAAIKDFKSICRGHLQLLRNKTRVLEATGLEHGPAIKVPREYLDPASIVRFLQDFTLYEYGSVVLKACLCLPSSKLPVRIRDE